MLTKYRDGLIHSLILGLTSVFLIAILFLSSPSLNLPRLGLIGGTPKGEVLSLIEREYIGEIPSDKEIQTAELKSLVESLKDPYSEYLTPEESQTFADALNERYQGVGIRFSRQDEQYVIAEVIPNSPAEQAGVQAGDVLLAVNKEPVQDVPSDVVGTKIRGEAGSMVELELQRGEKIISFNLTRQEIQTQVVNLRFENNVAILKVMSFADTLDEEFARKAQEVKQTENLKGVVLDLRNNTGGILKQGIYLSSYFMEKDLTVLQEKTKDRTFTQKSVERYPNLSELPVVVLVNGYTASAGEIVAASLRDNRQAKLIGQQTFGKGVVQQLFTLKNGGTLKLTIAEWLTPNGQEINNLGLKPDIIVPLDQDPLPTAIAELTGDG